jgi:hypothetical protein
MEQKYSEKVFAILHKKNFIKRIYTFRHCTAATAQYSLCTDFYEVIAWMKKTEKADISCAAPATHTFFKGWQQKNEQKSLWPILRTA